MPNLKHKTQQEIIEAIAWLNCGNANQVMLQNMIQKVRLHPRATTTLREVGDFVAHEVRNRGVTYEVALERAKHLQRFFMNGGSFGSYPLLTSQSMFALDLVRVLKDEGITDIDFRMLTTKEHELMRSVIYMISGSTIEFKDRQLLVEKVELTHDDSGLVTRLYISFHMRQTGETFKLVGGSVTPVEFGPNNVISTELLRAVPAGLNESPATILKIYQPADSTKARS